MRKDPLEMSAGRRTPLNRAQAQAPVPAANVRPAAQPPTDCPDGATRPTSAIDAAFAQLDEQLARVDSVVNQQLHNASQSSRAASGKTPSPGTRSQRELFESIAGQLEALDRQREALARLLADLPQVSIQPRSASDSPQY